MPNGRDVYVLRLTHAPVDAYRLTVGPDWMDPVVHVVYAPVEFVVDDWAEEHCVPIHTAYCDYVDLWINLILSGKPISQ